MSLLRPQNLVAAVTLVSIGLTGCAGHQSPVANPQLNLPADFSLSGQAVAQNKWWLAFQDRQLNTLVDRAMAANFDLRSNFARVKKARAVKIQANSRRGINVGAGLEGRNGDGSDQYTGSLAASYEVDLWGELSAAYAEADFDYMASRQQYRAAAITLVAEVASTWYELLAAEQALVVYHRQLAVNESILVLAQEQFINGITTISDSTQQAAQVASSKAAIANQQAIVDALRHSLNVLLGNSAKQPVVANAMVMPPLPPLPVIGIPAAILAQRPDIHSQWLEIQSTQAEVAQAIAAHYPSLSIGVTGESIAASAADLLSAWSTTLLSSLAVDIWTSGNNAAVVEEKQADAELALNDYGQRVLEAIQETEDALSRERHVEQRLAHLEQQRALTYQALEQLKTYYINGSSTFTELLGNLNSAQSLDIEVIDVQQNLIANRITLYRTLSAGWDMPELEN